jgi:hypothetical protein
MTLHSYHECGSTFGQAMLTLRTSIGLTLPVQLSPHAETPVAPADLEPAAFLIAKLPAWNIGWEKECQD